MYTHLTKVNELWASIERKSRSHEEETLTDEEKHLICDRIIDAMQSELFHTTDEELLQMLSDRGLI